MAWFGQVFRDAGEAEREGERDLTSEFIPGRPQRRSADAEVGGTNLAGGWTAVEVGSPGGAGGLDQVTELHNRAALAALLGRDFEEYGFEVPEYDAEDPEDFYKKLFQDPLSAGLPSMRSQAELQRPVRDPYTDSLLEALHTFEVYHPTLAQVANEANLMLLNLIFIASIVLNAVTVGVMWSAQLWRVAVPSIVLLLVHNIVSGIHVAYVSRTLPAGRKRTLLLWGSWAAVPLLFDPAMVLMLPLEPLLVGRRLPPRIRRHVKEPAAAACMWLWQYRLARMTISALLQALPMMVLAAVMLGVPSAASRHYHGHTIIVGGSAEHSVLIAQIVVSGLHVAVTFFTILLNARASGGMPLPRYLGLVALLRAARQLPLEWQERLEEEDKLTLRPDDAGFSALTRPQQVNVLALALLRPHLLLSTTAQHPRQRHSSSTACEGDSREAAKQAAHEARWARSCCVVLQSRQAVKLTLGLMPVPLARARSSLKGEFSVVLTSFSDANACRHCWPLLELLLSHGLKALQVTDTPLAQDIFSVLGRYLPTPGACLVKLQLKDVLAGGITTLCMLCDALAPNTSVTSLDLANNQLWGVRGARELRGMLSRNRALRELTLPFCGITSQGACELILGASESRTLEHLDLSQNHIGDDVPWPNTGVAAGAAGGAGAGLLAQQASTAAGPGKEGSGLMSQGSDLGANLAMKSIDMSFNWVQDALASWIVVLLETFPNLSRLQLDHNTDTAASRAVSMAVSRTLTPRTVPGMPGSNSLAGGGGGAGGGPGGSSTNHASFGRHSLGSASITSDSHTGGGISADWQAQMIRGTGGAAVGRSRGQHLAAHLMLYNPSIMATIARMEVLDLRGLPLPSWWARGPRPQSVLIDEGAVYVDEMGPGQQGLSLSAGAPISDRAASSLIASVGSPGSGMQSVGAGAGAGAGALEVPRPVAAAMDAATLDGVLMVDLMSPEYRLMPKAQQLAVIYYALSKASHVIVTNTSVNVAASNLGTRAQNSGALFGSIAANSNQLHMLRMASGSGRMPMGAYSLVPHAGSQPLGGMAFPTSASQGNSQQLPYAGGSNSQPLHPQQQYVHNSGANVVGAAHSSWPHFLQPGQLQAVHAQMAAEAALMQVRPASATSSAMPSGSTTPVPSFMQRRFVPASFVQDAAGPDSNPNSGRPSLQQQQQQQQGRQMGRAMSNNNNASTPLKPPPAAATLLPGAASTPLTTSATLNLPVPGQPTAAKLIASTSGNGRRPGSATNNGAASGGPQQAQAQALNSITSGRSSLESNVGSGATPMSNVATAAGHGHTMLSTKDSAAYSYMATQTSLRTSTDSKRTSMETVRDGKSNAGSSLGMSSATTGANTIASTMGTVVSGNSARTAGTTGTAATGGSGGVAPAGANHQQHGGPHLGHTNSGSSHGTRGSSGGGLGNGPSGSGHSGSGGRMGVITLPEQPPLPGAIPSPELPSTPHSGGNAASSSTSNTPGQSPLNVGNFGGSTYVGGVPAPVLAPRRSGTGHHQPTPLMSQNSTNAHGLVLYDLKEGSNEEDDSMPGRALMHVIGISSGLGSRTPTSFTSTTTASSPHGRRGGNDETATGEMPTLAMNVTDASGEVGGAGAAVIDTVSVAAAAAALLGGSHSQVSDLGTSPTHSHSHSHPPPVLTPSNPGIAPFLINSDQHPMTLTSAGGHTMASDEHHALPRSQSGNGSSSMNVRPDDDTDVMDGSTQMPEVTARMDVNMGSGVTPAAANTAGSITLATVGMVGISSHTVSWQRQASGGQQPQGLASSRNREGSGSKHKPQGAIALMQLAQLDEGTGSGSNTNSNGPSSKGIGDFSFAAPPATTAAPPTTTTTTTSSASGMDGIWHAGAPPPATPAATNSIASLTSAAPGAATLPHMPSPADFAASSAAAASAAATSVSAFAAAAVGPSGVPTAANTRDAFAGITSAASNIPLTPPMLELQAAMLDDDAASDAAALEALLNINVPSGGAFGSSIATNHGKLAMGAAPRISPRNGNSKSSPQQNGSPSAVGRSSANAGSMLMGQSLPEPLLQARLSAPAKAALIPPNSPGSAQQPPSRANSGIGRTKSVTFQTPSQSPSLAMTAVHNSVRQAVGAAGHGSRPDASPAQLLAQMNLVMRFRGSTGSGAMSPGGGASRVDLTSIDGASGVGEQSGHGQRWGSDNGTVVRVHRGMGLLPAALAAASSSTGGIKNSSSMTGAMQQSQHQQQQQAGHSRFMGGSKSKSMDCGGGRPAGLTYTRSGSRLVSLEPVQDVQDLGEGSNHCGDAYLGHLNDGMKPSGNGIFPTSKDDTLVAPARLGTAASVQWDEQGVSGNIGPATPFNAVDVAGPGVTVVLQVGMDGLLWLPLRALELPLRAAVARRPGLAVSFKIAGISHNAMRQLQALMSATQPPGLAKQPSRALWMLPSSASGLALGMSGSMALPSGQAAANLGLRSQLSMRSAASDAFNMTGMGGGGGGMVVPMTGGGSGLAGPLMAQSPSRASTGLLDLPPLDLGPVLSGDHVSMAQMTFASAQNLAKLIPPSQDLASEADSPRLPDLPRSSGPLQHGIGAGGVVVPMAAMLQQQHARTSLGSRGGASVGPDSHRLSRQMGASGGVARLSPTGALSDRSDNTGDMGGGAHYTGNTHTTYTHSTELTGEMEMTGGGGGGGGRAVPSVSIGPPGSEVNVPHGGAAFGSVVHAGNFGRSSGVTSSGVHAGQPGVASGSHGGLPTLEPAVEEQEAANAVAAVYHLKRIVAGDAAGAGSGSNSRPGSGHSHEQQQHHHHQARLPSPPTNAAGSSIPLHVGVHAMPLDSGDGPNAADHASGATNAQYGSRNTTQMGSDGSRNTTVAGSVGAGGHPDQYQHHEGSGPMMMMMQMRPQHNAAAGGGGIASHEGAGGGRGRGPHEVITVSSLMAAHASGADTATSDSQADLVGQFGGEAGDDTDGENDNAEGNNAMIDAGKAGGDAGDIESGRAYGRRQPHHHRHDMLLASNGALSNMTGSMTGSISMTMLGRGGSGGEYATPGGGGGGGSGGNTNDASFGLNTLGSLGSMNVITSSSAAAGGAAQLVMLDIASQHSQAQQQPQTNLRDAPAPAKQNSRLRAASGLSFDLSTATSMGMALAPGAVPMLPAPALPDNPQSERSSTSGSRPGSSSPIASVSTPSSSQASRSRGQGQGHGHGSHSRSSSSARREGSSATAAAARGTHHDHHDHHRDSLECATPHLALDLSRKASLSGGAGGTSGKARHSNNNAAAMLSDGMLARLVLPSPAED